MQLTMLFMVLNTQMLLDTILSLLLIRFISGTGSHLLPDRNANADEQHLTKP